MKFVGSAKLRGSVPAAWVSPVAVADSIGGSQVGVPFTIADAQLMANDTYDSRGAIQITSVQSAVNCTVSHSGTTVTVTPSQQSSVTFQYTITDSHGLTSNATVTMTGVAAGGGTVKKPITGYLAFGPFTADVLAAYNITKTSIIYQRDSFDKNTDGVYDGNNFGTYVQNRVPATATGDFITPLDWEYDTTSPARGFVGQYSGFNDRNTYPSNPNQDAAIAEMVKAINFCRSVRPNIVWGYYQTPTYWAVAEADIDPTGNTNWWDRQASTLQPICAVSDYLMPEYYHKQVQGVDVTLATMQKRARNYAKLSLMTAEPEGLDVWLDTSTCYYGGSKSGQSVPPLDCYNFVAPAFSVSYNGKKIKGLYLWKGGADPAYTEAHLKAFYQAANGLPYDPNMPRPS